MRKGTSPRPVPASSGFELGWACPPTEEGQAHGKAQVTDSCALGTWALTSDQADSSRRMISAPALSACNLPRATCRGSGAMPQLVDG